MSPKQQSFLMIILLIAVSAIRADDLPDRNSFGFIDAPLGSSPSLSLDRDRERSNNTDEASTNRASANTHIACDIATMIPQPKRTASLIDDYLPKNTQLCPDDFNQPTEMTNFAIRRLPTCTTCELPE